MDYFIQTRGEEADYCWVTQTTDGEQSKTTPPVLAARDLEVLSGTHFSLVLNWLSDSQLLLMVKNLPSNRQDFRERLIRNTLVCIAPVTEEKLIRGITAAALEGHLEQTLNQLIQPAQTNPTGFQVNFAELVNQLNSFEATASSPAEIKRYYFRDNQLFRNKLAQELLNFNLPIPAAGFEPLVLLSRNLDAAYFENSKVWRGLSERVDEEEKKPVPHELSPLELPEAAPSGGKAQLNKNMIFLLVITVVAALIFLAGTVLNFGSR